jgi:hypothetical protein
MLTLRQLDSIVHNTLLTFKGFEIERREEGTNIFYNIYDNHESAKTFLGTYRVWEWHDGSSRCGWMPLDTNDSYAVRIRNMVWEAVMVMAVPANLSTEDDMPPAKSAIKEPPKSPEPQVNGGQISLWLDWYHSMLDNGYKCTLEDVANKSGYSLGYIKQQHMIYQAKNNQKT